MRPNLKLTNAIKGRTVAEFENANGTLTVRFEDGGFMRVRATAETSSRVPRGARMTEAAMGDRHLELHLEDGSIIGFTLSDPANAVSVRDGQDKVLYLG